MNYRERVTSRRTSALFACLTILFLALCVWRATVHGFGVLAAVFALLSALFLFYTVNYRTLVVHLTSEALKVKFGLFRVTVPVDNIEAAQLDNVPQLLRYGGAGIHWMSVHGRYRISLNFMEYPRVVVALHRKLGPARDISFTTRHPNEVIRLLQEVSI